MSAAGRRRLLLAAAAAWVAPARAAPPLLTLGTGTRAPLVSVDGEPGFVEEVAREAFARAGLRLAVVVLPVERALQNANAGIEDGDLYRAAGFEAEYPNLIRVPEPLIEQAFCAFTLRPEVSVRDWSDLARYRVAHITGQKIIERRLQGLPEVTTVRNTELLLGLLVADRADVAIHNRYVALREARRAGIVLHEQRPPLLKVPMYIYLHRRHEALVPQLADAIAAVRRDGTWQRLYDRILAPLEREG